MTTTSQVLAIAGMHRSGTSVTAGWLSQCGLFIGDELIPPTESNQKGHFEDLSISLFQRRILQEAGYDTYLIMKSPSVPLTDYTQDVHKILQQRDPYPQWGWKDPRTTLLLPFWKHYIPNLKVLAVFRPYELVIHSLLKREIRNLKYHRYKGRLQRLQRKVHHLFAALYYSYWNVWLVRRYLATWRQYNQDLLRYREMYPDDTLILHIDSLQQHHKALLQFLNDTWGFQLIATDYSDFFDSSLMQNVALPLIGIDMALIRECNDLYNTLTEQSHLSIKRFSGLEESHVNPTA